MISKENFCSVIESMRFQVNKDKQNCLSLEETSNTEQEFPYDNSELIKAIILLLQVYFPEDKNRFCEICFYCFILDFGKEGAEGETETSEQLYDRLISKI